MSADRLALLDALRDEPHDERLRLIYADWLDDNGDPTRAEFIRLCQELSTLDAQDPRAARLERRRLQMIREHRKVWGPGLPASAVGHLARRGLVQRFDGTAAAFLKCAGRLLD